jgi:histone deacetylase 1/2
MEAEFAALQRNQTWTLVERPPGAKVISGKWVFTHKFGADGTLDKYKARWVVRGDLQREGIDFGETFTPVVKPATIRSVLTVIASKQWPAHQLDVSNAFLHGNLSERVYCQQPAGFVDPDRPDAVCLLSRSLYGLRQAPRAWFTRFMEFVTSVGFTQCRSDSSLFILLTATGTAFLLLYVDDMVLSASSDTLLKHIIAKLRSVFAIKDMGPLRYFLGVDVKRSSEGFFLSQANYVEDLLERAGMSNCKEAATPADARAKVSAEDGRPLSDGSFYRSMAGALQYLTLTRPDIAFAVQQVCLHMHAPRDVHLTMLKRILRYIKGTPRLGILLRASTSTTLTAYTDADWAGCPDTRRSTSGFCVFLGDSLVSWSSKRQTTVSRSSAEAEYRGVANAVAECTWLRNLLAEINCNVDTATLVFCDNVSTVYMTRNPVHHKRTKHIELDIHFVREKVALGEVRVAHIPSTQQLADVFTKGLPTALYLDFRRSLCNQIDDDAASAGGC